MATYLSPEQEFFKKHTQREAPLSLTEENILDKIGRQYLKQRPKPEDFEDIFGKKTIEEDLAKLRAKTEREGYKEEHERALALEALLWHDIEQQNWLGEDIFTAPVSEFDNKIRGFDFVLEGVKTGADGKEEVFRVGVDVILADRPEAVFEKWVEIVFGMKLIAKSPSSMRTRYFKSAYNPGLKGEILIPRVILGMDRSHYSDLIEVIASKDEEALANHPVKDLIKSELEMQLTQLKRLPPQILKFVEKNIEGILSVIKSGSKTSSASSNWAKEDNVYLTLKECLSDQKLFKEIIEGIISPTMIKTSKGE